MFHANFVTDPIWMPMVMQPIYKVVESFGEMTREEQQSYLNILSTKLFKPLNNLESEFLENEISDERKKGLMQGQMIQCRTDVIESLKRLFMESRGQFLREPPIILDTFLAEQAIIEALVKCTFSIFDEELKEAPIPIQEDAGLFTPEDIRDLISDCDINY